MSNPVPIELVRAVAAEYLGVDFSSGTNESEIQAAIEVLDRMRTNRMESCVQRGVNCNVIDESFRDEILTKHDGISIAIDCASGSALLLFKPSDVDFVRHVADVFQPFEAGRLTSAQRKELLYSLDYYERLLQRGKVQEF
jgi:hypothetical protein